MMSRTVQHAAPSTSSSPPPYITKSGSSCYVSDFLPKMTTSIPTPMIPTTKTSCLPTLVVVKSKDINNKNKKNNNNQTDNNDIKNNMNHNKKKQLRRSICFDESVRVRLIPYHSSRRINKLWYQEEDYDRFRSKIQSLATLAKEYQKKHGKPIFMPGMEKWTVEDNNMNNHKNTKEEEEEEEEEEDSQEQSDQLLDDITTIPVLSTKQLRSQSIGRVIMEQCFQKQQCGCVFNDERLAKLYKIASHPAQVLARQRAVRIKHWIDHYQQQQQDGDDDDDDQDDASADSSLSSISSVSSDASSKNGILLPSTTTTSHHHHVSANGSPLPPSMLLMPASRAA
ncbi:hypothetical protein IV203_037040 [Nitzschia inconspicua]|uniref:Uncharacterized protein n=1 Tax=Nitzschia inconspicua TaxID=303405 RepID=A0A9K3Q0M9_9STRA|nr:hypothetical protein IV203_037040 [Nitzschia inconspicua]